MVRIKENEFLKDSFEIKPTSTSKKQSSGSDVTSFNKSEEVFCGISDESVSLLERQIAHEIRNYAIYMSFAGFYAQQGMPLMSKYFKLRAKEEIEHAEWCHDFMETTGCVFFYPTVEIEEENILDLLYPMKRTVEIEQETTAMIGDMKTKSADDILLQHWLLDGPLVEEQIEEEEISVKLYHIAADDEVKWDKKEKEIYKTFMGHLYEFESENEDED